MINVIRSNFYKFSKSKFGYFYLGLVLLNVIVFIILQAKGGNYLVSGAQELSLFSDPVQDYGFMIILFTAMMVHVDFSNGSIKNILGRGILREKYLIGNIISFSIVSILIWLSTTLIIIVVDSIIYKFGTGIRIDQIFFSYILGIIYIIAYITMIVSITAITKSGIIGAIVAVAIYNINTFVGFIGIFMKKNIDIHNFSMSFYLYSASQGSVSNEFIFRGIGLGVLCIIIFSIIGIVILKRQDVK
ncbi:ABC transporter permease [uncultured Clostridium sp.]|jgi:ABC-type transport system involved in multi-copper enzyme maturation permease subunit|uniref:ABC transporter permease n=1 Tax=uncultured Clostridium sp. TaxID=59620 RepID=UPI00260D5D16|nr:ABC transporter permease [uncultured Clostridium sp.]